MDRKEKLEVVMKRTNYIWNQMPHRRWDSYAFNDRFLDKLGNYHT